MSSIRIKLFKGETDFGTLEYYMNSFLKGKKIHYIDHSVSTICDESAPETMAYAGSIAYRSKDDR